MSVPSAPELRRAVLVGTCVRLRPHRSEDLPRAFRLLHQVPAITDQLLWDGPRCPQDLEPWFASWVHGPRGERNYFFALTAPEDDEYLGSLGLRFEGHPREGDLGYWVGLPYQRRGLAGEAVRLATDLAFRHLEAVLVYASVFEGNIPSEKVLRRAGFEHDPRGDRSVQKCGAGRLCRFFHLARSAWEREEACFRPLAADIELAPTTRPRHRANGTG